MPRTPGKIAAVAREFWAKQRDLEAKRKAAALERALEERQQKIADAFDGVPLMKAALPEPRIDVSMHEDLSRVDMIYAVWPERDVYVKIGRTRGTRSRLSGLQTGNPRRLHIVMLIPSGQNGWTEWMLHDRFREHNVSGEWFALEGEVRDWLQPSIQALLHSLSDGGAGGKR